MGDDLLRYYNDELAILRDLISDEFAQANPKLAARLGMGRAAVRDPHVERLIEAVAYLNARTRYKLEDDFPELSDALLGVLYPHYLTPIPSLSVVQFQPEPELMDRIELPVGTPLETDPIEGEPCRFRTCYPVTLLPIKIDSAALNGRPLPAPAVPESKTAQTVLRLSLRTTAKDVTFSGLGTLIDDSRVLILRFFLKGQEQPAFSLYDLLCNSPLQIAIAASNDDPNPVLLGPDCLRPMGFTKDEGLVPYPPRAFLGYRLLTEYFAFPEKFLFLEFTLNAEAMERFGDRFEIFVYSPHGARELEGRVNADSFCLGCSPIVNLFEKTAEPVVLKQTTADYEAVPDTRRRAALEVFTVDQVTASDTTGKSFEYLPFYGAHHGQEPERRRFWQPVRRPARTKHGGTEMFLRLVDLDFRPSTAEQQVLHVELTCLNRDLPNRLPFGGGQPHLRLYEGAAPTNKIICLTPPTPTVRPPLRERAVWRLISHLSLNHLSITDPETGSKALREILKLYDFKDSEKTRGHIEGIVDVRSKAVPGRVPGRGFDNIARGIEIQIQFDENRFAGRSLFLFASVIEHFLGLYCSLNSFTRLTATFQNGERVLKRWPPRAGEQQLL